MKFPLTSEQTEILALSQINSDASKAYEEVVYLYLEGNLSHPALEHAVQKVLIRYPILTATFSSDGTLQETNPSSQPALNFYDVSSDLSLEKSNNLQNIINKLAEEKINLETGPVFITSLVKVDLEKHLLIITGHHIVMDGWSVSQLLQELSLFYSNYLGSNFTFESDPMQFSTYVEEKSKQLNSSLLHTNQYWENELSPPLSATLLTSDYVRPSRKSYKGNCYYFRFHKEQKDRLERLGKENGMTLFIMLLGAFKLLVNGYTRQEEIIIGIPCSKRDTKSTLTCVGHCSTLLPIRTLQNEDDDILDFFKQVRKKVYNAFDNKSLDFNALARKFGLNWDPSRSGLLIDIVFNVDTFKNNLSFIDLKSTVLSGNNVEELFSIPLDIHHNTSKFDLFMNAIEHEEYLDVFVEYSTDLYTETFIKEFCESYLSLINNLNMDPERCLKDLTFLTPQTHNKIVNEWNQTQREYPEDKLVTELFAEQVLKHPNNIALKINDDEITYEQLDQKSDSLASYLLKKGLMTGDNVIVALDRSTDYIISILAILKAGGTYIPINYHLPIERIKEIIEDSCCKMFLSNSKLVHSQLIDKFFINIDSSSYSSAIELLDEDKNKQTSSDLAYIIYTSGSTGKPKGATVTHKGIIRTVKNTNYINISPQDCISLICDLSFDVSMFEIWGALLNGATLAIFKKDEILDPAKLEEKLLKYQVNIGTLTPALFHMIAQNDPNILGSYNTLIVVGDVLDPYLSYQVANSFPKLTLLNCYGPTEATIFATFYKVPMTVTGARVPIGKPISNTTIYILDTLLKPVPIGAIGEIYIGGPGVSPGYLNRPELNEMKFIMNPFSDNPSNMLFKTGDLARFLSDGNIDFIGRADSQVKISGYRVELGEIENKLRLNPLIDDIAVLPCKNSNNETYLNAYISLSHSKDMEAYLEEEEANHQKLSSNENELPEWNAVWDQTYRTLNEQDSTSFNLTGWINSYDSKPFPDEIMEEWVDTTVKRILRLRPRRILEIGCGTGLLLFRIAPYVESYFGIDSSKSALDFVQKTLKESSISNVTLKHMSADEIDQINYSDFDLVIINSVVQYFPNINYLSNVLDAVISRLDEKGCVYIGDVRSFSYQEAFQCSVEFYKAPDNILIQELYTQIDGKLLREEELLIDPLFFKKYVKNNLKNGSLEVDLKRLHATTEISKFRYDVILFKEKGRENDNLLTHVLNWEENNLTLLNLEAELAKEPSILIIDKIPNGRLRSDTDLVQLIENISYNLSVGELRKVFNKQCPKLQLLDPNDLWKFENKSPYRVLVSFDDNNEGDMNAIFIKEGIGYFSDNTKIIPNKPYCNYPATHKYLTNISKNISKYAEQILPEYMIPNQLFLVHKIPHTNSGKLNRNLLANLQIKANQKLIAPRNSVEQLLYNSLKDFIMPEISVDTNLINAGLTSLSIIRWIMVLRKNGIILRPQAIFMNPTIEKIAQIISNKCNAFDEDPSFTTYNEESSIEKMMINFNSINNILLTGATGFLGIHLLKDLLDNTHAKIYCLIRGNSIEEAYARLEESFKWQFISSNYEDALKDRICIILGDISLPQLGLKAEAWEALSKIIQLVYHCAANVRHMGIPEIHQTTNLLGTDNVIRFCEIGNKKILHFVSTIAVMGILKDKTQKEFNENDLAIGQHFIDPYSESKYLAEVKVREFIKRGGEANIYRIGTIGAHSQTGNFQKNIEENYFTRMINSLINLKVAPHLPDFQQDYLSVDVVSKSIMKLSQNKINKTYHIYNTNTLQFPELCQMLQAFGYPIKVVDFNTFGESIIILAEKYSLQDNLGGILDVLDSNTTHAPNLTCTETYRDLHELQIYFQKPDSSEILNLINHGIKRGYFTPPIYYSDFTNHNTF